MKIFSRIFVAIALFFLVAVVSGCSDGSSGDSTSHTGGDGIIPSGDTTDPGTTPTVIVDTVDLAATTSSIETGGTTSLTATLRDSANALVGAGVSVAFSVGDSSYGGVSPATATTNAAGVATASFTALTKAGAASVTATSGGKSDTVDITITKSSSGIVTGTAFMIGLVASAGSIYPGNTVDITATAYDNSGGKLSNVSLVFTLDDPTLASIEREAVTGAEGTATVTLTSRTNTGTIKVTATGNVASAPLAIIIEALPDANAPDSIDLGTANPETIIVEKTSTVSATVLDSNGDPVAPGTSVTFTLSDSQFGTLTPETATTNAVGVATTTFMANNIVGEVEIAASTGTLKTTATSKITINGSAPASIEFVDTSANVIAIAESGGNQIATIRFIVLDANHNPVQGQNVRFLLDGPNGGETISEDPASPDELFVSTLSDGYAEVLLRSGFVAGPATITASILDDNNNPSLSVNAPVISIGGGVPTQKRLLVGASVKNLPGLRFLDRQLDMTAYMADRFGDYNILNGTSVAFRTESGLTAFSSSVSADNEGKASVKIRTQGIPEDVEANVAERALIDALNADYFGALNYNNTPRDGLCSVLVYTRGEEHFVDTNGNGVYNIGEVYEDTVDDPFCDYNGSGFHSDDPADLLTGATDPWEDFIDAASDGNYNVKNNVWDDDKYIFRNYEILITGSPMIVFAPSSTFPNDIRFIVCDQNFNPLTPGSTISVSQSFKDAKVKGDILHKFPDTNQPTAQLSDIEHKVWIEEAASTSGSVEVAVTWEGQEYKSSWVLPTLTANITSISASQTITLTVKDGMGKVLPNAEVTSSVVIDTNVSGTLVVTVGSINNTNNIGTTTAAVTVTGGQTDDAATITFMGVGRTVTVAVKIP